MSLFLQVTVDKLNVFPLKITHFPMLTKQMRMKEYFSPIFQHISPPYSKIHPSCSWFFLSKGCDPLFELLSFHESHTRKIKHEVSKGCGVCFSWVTWLCWVSCLIKKAQVQVNGEQLWLWCVDKTWVYVIGQLTNFSITAKIYIRAQVSFTSLSLDFLRKVEALGRYFGPLGHIYTWGKKPKLWILKLESKL